MPIAYKAGTCQVCERYLGCARTISHHGYQRPRAWHAQSPSCDGARYLPWEVDCKALEVHIGKTRTFRDDTYKRFDDFQRNPTPLVSKPADRKAGTPAEFVQPGSRLYPVFYRRECQSYVDRIRSMDEYIAAQQGRHGLWKRTRFD